MAIYHHCLGCKEEQRMKHVIVTMFKNARPAIQGRCVECGSKMTRMLPMMPATPTEEQKK